MNTKTTPLFLINFQQEAMRRAAARGWFPAQLQREVDWFHVMAWAEQVQDANFVWLDTNQGDVDGIIVSAGPNGTRAIHSGQHRILGGLMGGKEVPMSHMTVLEMTDPTRAWDAPVADVFDWMK